MCWSLFKRAVKPEWLNPETTDAQDQPDFVFRLIWLGSAGHLLRQHGDSFESNGLTEQVLVSLLFRRCLSAPSSPSSTSLGVIPLVSSGAPLSIMWEPMHSESVSVDEFERLREGDIAAQDVF